MVKLYKYPETIKGCRPSKLYQNYFNRTNKKYFEGSLPNILVLTAPLLKLKDEPAPRGKIWVDSGMYAITGYDLEGKEVMILDRGTAVFHPILTRQSILHEQIHWYLGLEVKGHGKVFKAQIRRIAALGAFDTLI